MNALMQFLSLRRSGEDKIWLALPVGIFSGTFVKSEEEVPQVIPLFDTLFYSGNTCIKVGDADLLMSQVSAWGDGTPTFIDKEK